MINNHVRLRLRLAGGHAELINLARQCNQKEILKELTNVDRDIWSDLNVYCFSMLDENLVLKIIEAHPLSKALGNNIIAYISLNESGEVKKKFIKKFWNSKISRKTKEEIFTRLVEALNM